MIYIRLPHLNNNIVITCNNQPLSFKKINGNYVAKIDDINANIKFIYHHELKDNLWFLKAFIMYILSFFGLFMMRYKKMFYSLDCEVKLQPHFMDTYYDINLDENNKDMPITITGGNYYFLTPNKFISDDKAKRNYRLLKTFTVLLNIVLLIIAVIIIVSLLIG